MLADAISRPLAFNLVVSNVPGPQMPFYLLGRQIEAIYPFVPLSPQNHALSIGVLTYDGSVHFGLAGDRDLLAGPRRVRRRPRGRAGRAGRRDRDTG